MIPKQQCFFFFCTALLTLPAPNDTERKRMCKQNSSRAVRLALFNEANWLSSDHLQEKHVQTQLSNIPLFKEEQYDQGLFFRFLQQFIYGWQGWISPDRFHFDNLALKPFKPNVFPILINWTSPFTILGLLGGIFHFIHIYS